MATIRVEWTEEVTCAHEWDLADAIEWANDRFEPELPADATAEEVADRFREMDLADELAEIEYGDRTEYEVVRSIGDIEAV